MIKYSENKFIIDNQQSIGPDFKQKIINYEDNSYKIQIWNASGVERYRNLDRYIYYKKHMTSLYRNTKGIILCYDISNYTSFNNL